MTKRVYGIYDTKTGNTGDVCTFDRDEEFIAGFTRSLSDSSFPDYFVSDLVGVCYGTLVTRDGYLPELKPFPDPLILWYGRDIVASRKDVCDE